MTAPASATNAEGWATRQETGRDRLRMHKPGMTWGCIAAKKQQDWDQMYDLISNTKNKGSVVDLSTPWWKGLTVENLTLYGTLCVY